MAVLVDSIPPPKRANVLLECPLMTLQIKVLKCLLKCSLKLLNLQVHDKLAKTNIPAKQQNYLIVINHAFIKVIKFVHFSTPFYILYGAVMICHNLVSLLK